MDSQTSIRSFALAFRGQWFAAMSGGFSVPFTALAVFLDNKYQQIIFGCLAFAAVWYAVYTIWKIEREKVISLQGAAHDRHRRRETKARLGEFIRTGMTLLESPAFLTSETSEKDAQSWLDGLCAYLRSNEYLGEVYVDRLRSSDGLGGSWSSNKVESGVKFRIARLHEFLRELPAE